MDRKELVAKLELVSRALADNDIIPIFKCFAFTGSNVIAYNDALAIVAPCKTQEKFCVNGKILLGLLTNSHAEEITFKRDAGEIEVKTGKSVFRLPWFPVEDFLFKPPAGPWEKRVIIDEELLGGLQACLLTASKDNTQAALMGVCMTEQGFYSTDGDAITRYLHQTDKNTNSQMLPNSFCEAIIKLNGDGVLTTSKEWAKATSGEYMVYGRFIAVDNPIDYEVWIKKTVKSKPTFYGLPTGLDDALSRARVIADPESAATNLIIEGRFMDVFTETSMGQVSDTIRLPVDQPTVEAKVSAELVQRCISLCNEMAVISNCCCFRNGEKLFILTSNMGK